jgi:uncharacterized protein (DUF697 family)/tellurite resistance protein
MELREQRALLTVALLAAFADGAKADAERDEIQRIALSLGAQEAGLKVGTLVQEVLLKRITLAQAVADLSQPEHRQLAYELAVCICDADGTQSAAEAQFLAALKNELQVGAASAAFEAQADALAEITDRPLTASVPAAAPPPAAAAGAPAAAAVDGAALDKSILNQAILCGALELLPQSWASMAIIPLQVKMVYGIGQAHGVQLDQGHVKEFIATVGVGLTSQYLEQFGRKLLGGLLGTLAGGLGRGLGSAAGGMAMSFASTYALGQLAKRYYAGGRQMSTAVLQETYQSLLGNARQLQQQVLPQIEQRARSLDATQVLDLVRRPLA